MILSKNNFLNGKIGCFNRRKIKSEGGEKTSSTLRKIFREKYSVEVGLYSYGSCFEPKFNIGGKVKIGRYCSFGMDVHYFGQIIQLIMQLCLLTFITMPLAVLMLMM